MSVPTASSPMVFLSIGHQAVRADAIQGVAIMPGNITPGEGGTMDTVLFTTPTDELRVRIALDYRPKGLDPSYYRSYIGRELTVDFVLSWLEKELAEASQSGSSVKTIRVDEAFHRELSVGWEIYALERAN